VCLIPFSERAVTAAGHIAQGNYMTALYCAGTGTAATVILFGGMLAAAYFVQIILQKR
jgi:hypothetical protein